MNKNVFSIQQVFAERYFKVPAYQRSFAWEKEHCEELMEDLELLNDSFYHYTGTLVLLEKDKTQQDIDGIHYTQHEIVDGQQRLTSIVILLNIVVNELAIKDIKSKKLADGLRKNFIFTHRIEDEQPFFKLELNEETNEFFRHNILSNKKVIKGFSLLAHKRLDDANKYFLNYIENKKKELSESQFDAWLKNLYHKITQQLRLTLYPVDSAAEVGVIFEVMNNRGKELTEFEKVKNYLMYLTTKLELKTARELEERINKTWSEIFKRLHDAELTSSSEDQLLRAHWLMGYNPNKKEWKGSKSIKKLLNLKNYIERHKDLFHDIERYLTTLDEASIAFTDLEKPMHTKSFNAIENRNERNKARMLSLKLQRNNTLASFRPIVIACRLVYQGKGFEYNQLVNLLEKFAFRIYGLDGKRADTGQNKLFRLSYNLYNQKIEFNDLIRKIKSIIKTYSPQEKFNNLWEFEEGDNWYNWSSIKYFLYEYEDYLTDLAKVPLRIPWDEIKDRPLQETIEHILPQKITSRYWRERFNKKDHRRYLNDLGNLCLTYNNSSYSNKDFTEKKGKPNQSAPCYATSSLKQENELTRNRDWNVKKIMERRKVLLKWAKNRWNVDLSDVDAENTVEPEVNDPDVFIDE